ncbi:MAG: YceI family protein [Bacteroidota bacterium]
MRKFILLSLISTIGVFHSNAQVFTTKSGSATFFSESPLENIEATSNNIQSILNTSTKSIAFIISIRSFKFEKDLMQEHFNEKYMESDKYPNATFSGKINEDFDLTKDGSYNVTSTGKIAMHGQEKEITTPGVFTVKDGEATMQSNFPLAVSDFKIEIPQLLFHNIADTVAVKVNVTYQAYKK